MTEPSSRAMVPADSRPADPPPTAGAAVAWSWQRPDPRAEVTGESAAARRQGVIGGVVGLAFAALFFFWLHRRTLAEVVAAIAIVTTLAALLSPRGLYRQLTRLLDLLAHAVGTVVTWILMVVLYALLFVPVGLILRWTGKIALRTPADPAARSYWTNLEAAPVNPESYSKQF